MFLFLLHFWHMCNDVLQNWLCGISVSGILYRFTCCFVLLTFINRGLKIYLSLRILVKKNDLAMLFGLVFKAFGVLNLLQIEKALAFRFKVNVGRNKIP